MPGTIRYDVAATPGNLLDNVSGQFNSLATLANGAAAVGPNAWDNTPTTGRGDFWADFELNITFPVAPTNGGNLDLYLLETIDGVSYMDGVSGVAPITSLGSFVGSFAARNVTVYQRIPLRQVVLPPTKFFPMLVNNAGQTTANSASGMTLRILPYREQY